MLHVLVAKRKKQSKVSNRQKVLTHFSSSNSHTTHHIVSTPTNEPKFKAVNDNRLYELFSAVLNSIEKAERFKERDFKITEEDLISPVSVDSHLDNQLFHNYNQFLKNCVRNYFDESGYLQFIDLIKLYKTHFKCGKCSFQFEKDEKIKTCKM